MVAKDAIMRDVAVCKDVVMRADTRHFAIAGGTVDGDVFAKSIMVADFRPRDAALPFQVLRFEADAGERKNFVYLPELCMAVNDDVRMEFTFRSERDVFADDAVGADFTSSADFCFFMNDSRTMNRRHKFILIPNGS